MSSLERRTALGRQYGVLPDNALDRVTAETAISVAHEQWPVGRVGPLVEPDAEYRRRVRPDRCRAILAPLAAAPDVGARGENDITAAEADQLGNPEPGLHAQMQKSPVPPPVPSRQVGGSEKRLDLLALKIFDHALLVALRRQSEHPLTMVQELRVCGGDKLDHGSGGICPAAGGVKLRHL